MKKLLLIGIIILLSAVMVTAEVSHPASQISFGNFPSGNYSFDGFLGIGTATPGAKLHVEGTQMALGIGETTLPTTHVNHRFLFLGINAIGSINSAGSEIQISSNSYIDTAGIRKYTTTNPATLYEQTNGYHAWYYNTTGTADTAVDFIEAMRIDTSGNVGIGTSTPTRELEVNGWAKATNFLAGSSVLSSGSLYHSTPSRAQFQFGTLQAGGAYPISIESGSVAYPNGSITFYTDDIQAMKIDSDGNVGIGTANPNATLEVRGKIKISNEDAVARGILIWTGYIASGTCNTACGNAYCLGAYTHSSTTKQACDSSGERECICVGKE